MYLLITLMLVAGGGLLELLLHRLRERHAEGRHEAEAPRRSVETQRWLAAAGVAALSVSGGLALTMPVLGRPNAAVLSAWLAIFAVVTLVTRALYRPGPAVAREGSEAGYRR